MANAILYNRQSQIGKVDLPRWNDYIRGVFEHNPFATDAQAVVQLVGCVGGKPVGAVSSLPLDVVVAGEKYRTAAGSSMWVDDAYRNTQYGIRLPIERLETTPNKFMVGSSQSQMMIKVSEFIKSTIFFSPRMIMLFRSRAVVEMKFGGMFSKVMAKCADLGLSCYWFVFKKVVKARMLGFDIVEVESSDGRSIKDVADIIRSDNAMCFEVHDERWLKWHMTQSFSDDGPLKLYLVRQSGHPVAFYMTKSRFYAQASHRGFKNVRIGSIMEWGCLPQYERLKNDILMDAALRFKGICDAVELIATEKDVFEWFSAKLWRHVGDGNFVFKIGKSSPLANISAIHNRVNWRLRPAMGDAGFN